MAGNHSNIIFKLSTERLHFSYKPTFHIIYFPVPNLADFTV